MIWSAAALLMNEIDETPIKKKWLKFTTLGSTKQEKQTRNDLPKGQMESKAGAKRKDPPQGSLMKTSSNLVQLPGSRAWVF